MTWTEGLDLHFESFEIWNAAIFFESIFEEGLTAFRSDPNRFTSTTLYLYAVQDLT